MELLVAKQDLHAALKGEIVEVWANGTLDYIGGALSPTMQNSFVVVKCPDKVITSDLAYLRDKWQLSVGMSVDSHDPVTDTYNGRLANTSGNSVAGRGAVIVARVTDVLQQWGAANIAQDGQEITFTLSLYDALTSAAFWLHDVQNVAFTEIDYNQATGVHQIQVVHSLNPSAMQNIVEIDKGLTVISSDATTLVFEAQRSDVQPRFKADIEAAVSGDLIGFSRFKLSGAAVDAVITGGGVATTNWAQLQNNLEDQAV